MRYAPRLELRLLSSNGDGRLEIANDAVERALCGNWLWRKPEHVPAPAEAVSVPQDVGFYNNRQVLRPQTACVVGGLSHSDWQMASYRSDP